MIDNSADQHINLYGCPQLIEPEIVETKLHLKFFEEILLIKENIVKCDGYFWHNHFNNDWNKIWSPINSSNKVIFPIIDYFDQKDRQIG